MEQKTTRLRATPGRHIDDTDISDWRAVAARPGFGALAETHSLLSRGGRGAGRGLHSFLDRMNRILRIDRFRDRR